MKATLVEAIAARLDQAAIGRWRPDGAYPAGATPAIFVGVVPPTPDAVIALDLYPVRPGLDSVDEIVGLQIRTRTAGADVRATWALDDAIVDALHGVTNTELAGRRITSIRHVSGASLGQDERKRWDWSSNFYITLPRGATP